MLLARQSLTSHDLSSRVEPLCQEATSKPREEEIKEITMHDRTISGRAPFSCLWGHGNCFRPEDTYADLAIGYPCVITFYNSSWMPSPVWG